MKRKSQQDENEVQRTAVDDGWWAPFCSLLVIMNVQFGKGKITKKLLKVLKSQQDENEVQRSAVDGGLRGGKNVHQSSLGGVAHQHRLPHTKPISFQPSENERLKVNSQRKQFDPKILKIKMMGKTVARRHRLHPTKPNTFQPN